MNKGQNSNYSSSVMLDQCKSSDKGVRESQSRYEDEQISGGVPSGAKKY